jgi:hypothetical protein
MLLLACECRIWRLQWDARKPDGRILKGEVAEHVRWSTCAVKWTSTATSSMLWSSGQSSCLQIQRSWFDSRRYQIFWEVVGLKRGSLSLVSTIEELLRRKSNGSDLENREYGRRILSRCPHGTLYSRNLTLTSPTSGGRSVGIFRSPTEATEFSLVCILPFTPRPLQMFSLQVFRLKFSVHF